MLPYLLYKNLPKHIFLLHFYPNDDGISQKVNAVVLLCLEDIATHGGGAPKRLYD